MIRLIRINLEWAMEANVERATDVKQEIILFINVS